MSKIEIKDIGINGNDLFDDSESFLNDLSEDTFNSVNGGGITVTITTLPPPTTGPTSPLIPDPQPHPGFPPCPPTRPPFPIFPIA